MRPECSYPSLPGCVLALDAHTGYGYDAWTHPDLRGSGIRRRTFLKELRRLREKASATKRASSSPTSSKGATRSLGRVGIVIEPVWRITLERDRSLRYDLLLPRADSLHLKAAA